MTEGDVRHAVPTGETSSGMRDGEQKPTRELLPAEVALQALARALPERIDADPEKVEQGLARIVLTVVELLRRVLEHQAVRRMDGGTLSDDEIERLGLALLKLSERMEELKTTFGLTDEDLSIDLGPLRIR